MFAQVYGAHLRQVLERVEHQLEREGTHDGTGKVAHAAQDNHHDGVRAHLETQQFGVDVATLHAPQITGQAGQCTGQRKGAQLVAEGAETDRAHAVFVDADAGQCAAKRAPQQPAQKGIHQQQHHQREVVQGELAVEVEQREAAHCNAGLEVDVQPVRAAQNLVVEEQEKHHLRKRHRDHDEVDAVCAHHEEADHQRRQARRQHGHRQGPPQAGGRVLWHQECQRVTGQAKVGRMPERHQAGKPLQQVQAHREDRQDHHARDHLGVELGAHEGKRKQRHQCQSERDLHAGWQDFEIRFSGAHCLNRPSGFHNNTAAISM